MSSNARIEQIKTFINEQPEDPFLWYALATEYVSLGLDQDALKIYLWLLENEPEYFATYYHLGKLYERMEEDDKAEKTYQAGMKITKKQGNKHAYGELRGAFEELTF